MRKMFVGNLAESTTESELRDLFSRHGKVRSLRLATDVFTGRCQGFGVVEMEGHEARAAMADLDGKTFKDHALRVREEQVAQGRAMPHHILPQSGWVSYPIRDTSAIPGVLDLFRLEADGDGVGRVARAVRSDRRTRTRGGRPGHRE